MKYWIFQNNQVLGPYEPDEMGKISVFSPESLVCPEGRRGTSMGDWQRAGMVPDLSVALVRATLSGGKKSAVLSIAGLPPEPTLKDLAQLGSVQEKVAMLEEIVLQLQEGLRVKDAELSSVHQELAGKSREANEIKSEAAARQNEAAELKRQLAGLEDRLASVRLLSETLDKAVEEERKVEADVEKQGQTLTDLAREVEELRRQLEDSKARQAERASAPIGEPPKMDEPSPFAAKANEPSPFAAKANEASPFAPLSAQPSLAPVAFPPSGAAPAPSPFADIAPPADSPKTLTPFPEIAAPPAEAAAVPPPPESAPSGPMEFPTINAAPMPAFEAPALTMPGGGPPKGEATSFDPMAFADPSAGALAPNVESAPSLDGDQVSAPPPPPKSKKGLLALVAVFAIGGAGALAVFGGFVPGLQKPKAPPVVLDTTPLPPPEAPVEAPDPRQLAVDFAKAWPLSGGRTLERALESLSPSTGNLSPWMADPLAGNRVQVNYFARSSAPGAPTIAYEFEVDLDGRTLVGRNAAAKSVLTGKAAAPPAPPKPKPVKVKPKAAPKAPEDTLDSMLGESSPAGEPKAPAKAAKAPAEMPALPGYGPGSTLTDVGDAAETGVAPIDSDNPRPTRPNPARRAAKAKGGKPAKGQAADETLLDDLLKE